jgi:plastocyanin
VHRIRSMALIGTVLSLTLVLAACGSGGTDASAEGSSADGGGETVSLAGAQFTPSSLTIPVGTTVTFTNTGGHTVTEGSDGVAVDDPIVNQQGGSNITVTFDEAGSYDITCMIHSSMNMTITVEE